MGRSSIRLTINRALLFSFLLFFFSSLLFFFSSLPPSFPLPSFFFSLSSFFFPPSFSLLSPISFLPQARPKKSRQIFRPDYPPSKNRAKKSLRILGFR